MPFNLNFPSDMPHSESFQLSSGEMLFVLGANGSGKSTLMQRFSSQNLNKSKKVSAYRQTFLTSSSPDLTSATKDRLERNIQNEDGNTYSRYRDSYAQQRPSLTLYDLIDLENVIAREIADAYRSNRLNKLSARANEDSPIATINELLRQSNMQITVGVRANDKVVARKDKGAAYGVQELSDGERNALLIAADVLTAPEGTLLIIDEPERHLHRSIISPLLGHLFELRSDCGFIISTHDHELPLRNPRARTLLLRSCAFEGEKVSSWEADELAPAADMDDVLKKDLLGARRKILFVEGTETSLDKPLYGLIFPMVSIVPKGSCIEAEKAVAGIRSGKHLHWLNALGIVDGDGIDNATVENKRELGVHCLPYYSVEAIYFHPILVRLIAWRQTKVLGGDRKKLAVEALAAGVKKIAPDTDRLSRKAAKKVVRRSILEQVPNDDVLLKGEDLVVANEAIAIHARIKTELDSAVASNDWAKILTKCPIRESGAREAIARSLRFQNVDDYERAVRKLLSDKPKVLNIVRGLFGSLSDELVDQQQE